MERETTSEKIAFSPQTIASVVLALLAVIGMIVTLQQVGSTNTTQISAQAQQLERLRTRMDNVSNSITGDRIRLEHIQDKVDWIAHDLAHK